MAVNWSAKKESKHYGKWDKQHAHLNSSAAPADGMGWSIKVEIGQATSDFYKALLIIKNFDHIVTRYLQSLEKFL